MQRIDHHRRRTRPDIAQFYATRRVTRSTLLSAHVGRRY
jgi:hypothetical protein